MCHRPDQTSIKRCSFIHRRHVYACIFTRVTPILVYLVTPLLSQQIQSVASLYTLTSAQPLEHRRNIVDVTLHVRRLTKLMIQNSSVNVSTENIPIPMHLRYDKAQRVNKAINKYTHRAVMSWHQKRSCIVTYFNLKALIYSGKIYFSACPAHGRFGFNEHCAYTVSYKDKLWATLKSHFSSVDFIVWLGASIPS